MNFAAGEFALDSGNTAWMLTASALVLLMTPGLAFFYGGMVRGKSVLNMMMMSFGAMGVVGIIWVLWGYSGAFGPDMGGGLLGKPFEWFGLNGLGDAQSLMLAAGVPSLVAVAFQATFAIITVALISGAIADRTKFSAWLIFSGIWVTIVYMPVAHWVWSGVGLLGPTGITESLSTPIDFAGGTVVHINAGIAGLVGCILLGKRIGLGKESMPPHSLTMTMIGASLMWFGWFGFTAGSALEANGSAALAFMNTYLATACAVLSWTLTEWIIKGKPSLLGAASGCVAGLVAITPAAGNVGIPGAFVIGLVAGVVCLWGVTGLKKIIKVDDSLDVFGVHAVGGITGALLTGIFNAPSLGGPGFYNNWFEMKPGYGDIMSQFIIQAKAVGVTVIWTAISAFIAFKVADLIVGLRVPEDEEREGLDTTSHGELAYHD